MKNRLVKNYVTTGIGLLCIGGAFYMYLSKVHTFTEASELAALGLLFLRSKDSLIGLEK